MTTPIELTLTDGRTLRAWDAGAAAGRLPVLWHHGTPGLGELPEPLAAVAAEVGIRWLGYDRPGYGGSTRDEGRDVAAAAGDVAQLMDALGIERFATLGASGGAPHALACAALLPDRVTAVAAVAALAPFGADDLDWFAGMYPGGEAELRASVAGRDALVAHLTAGAFDPQMFTAADFATLAGEWAWIGGVAGRALGGDEGAVVGGMVDDDLAFVAPWGFDLDAVTAPTLVLHGTDDRVVPPAHGRWLAEHLPAAELQTVDGAGHLAVLDRAADACRRLAASTP